jgi:hypothetical protein
MTLQGRGGWLSRKVTGRPFPCAGLLTSHLQGLAMSTQFKCTTDQLITPEFLRLLAIANHRENQKAKAYAAACRAWGLLNKFTRTRKKTTDFKAKHRARLAVAMNKLRAV